MENQNVILKWAEVERLAYMLSVRFYRAYRERCMAAGMTCDDLKQAAYIVYADAVSGFDSTRGVKFVTYYGVALYRYCVGVCIKRNPLNTCVSLSKPIDDNEPDADTLEDITADSDGERGIDSVAERDYNEQLHADLERIINMLDATEAAYVRAHWLCDSVTAREAGKAIGIEAARVQAVSNRAMSRLRKFTMSDKAFRQYRDDIISRHAYRGFDPTAYTVLKLDEAEAYRREQ